ncbi:class I SAM-dependent methyltransferase [Streptomyces sp. HPF1205]|uniref:class I SAM-dependent methyltransferase n=1 Tax=Streptomyces sp. HPF1205 TaxID=2873262 RepID=UPI001CED5E96|nr:class I SAM-dependent methyltransferase [Streptomyces sp. HPF1205]
MARQPCRHPHFARFWAAVAGPGLDRAGIGPHRARLLAGLSGRVVEIGAGNGLTFPYYPPEVTRVLAVEPEPRLRALAGERARRLAREPGGVPAGERAAGVTGTTVRPAPPEVRVVGGRAERLPAASGAFDAAVVCLTLCSVADQAAALAEIRRVLRPGGQLRFLEHVRARTPGMRRVQRAVDATFWPLLCGGCHTGRDTRGAIAAAGFTLVRVEDFAFPDTRVPSPATAHILGVAERPEQPVPGAASG